MNEDWREREADLRSEYEAEAAYEASEEEAYWNCEHEDWEYTELLDVSDKRVRTPEDGFTGEITEWVKCFTFQIECDDCGRTSTAKVIVEESDIHTSDDWSDY